MIIDPSNAPCGPGSIPGLRLSEGRFQSIGAALLHRGWRVAELRLSVRPSSDVAGRRVRLLAPFASSPSRHCAVTVGRRLHCGPRSLAACLCLGTVDSERFLLAARAGSRPPPPSPGRECPSRAPHTTRLVQRPQIRREDPLNLSILLSGGKETNKDSLSSGERRGKSPAPNRRPPRARDMWRTGDGRRPGVDRGPESF